MNKIVIFDWSGVISDDRPSVYEANMMLLKKYGKKRITFKEWLPNTKLNVVEYLMSHDIDVESATILKEYKKAFDKVRRIGINPKVYPDVVSVVRKLSHDGVRLFVVSTHPAQNLEKEAKEYGVYKFFDNFIGSVQNKAETIMSILGKIEKPKRVFYVGDTIYDIQAAKKAKVKSVAITTGYHIKKRLKKEKPDIMIDSLMELLRYL